MKLATRTIAETPDDDLAMLTSEHHTMVQLSETMGIPLESLLRQLWSSEVVEYRAAHLISVAQQALQSDKYQADAEKARRKSSVGGRRRR